MTIDTVRAALLWCAILDYALLTFWFLVFVLAHDWLYRLHIQWFALSPEQFDRIHYGGMAGFKLATLVFAVVPYVALRIVG